jgi:hypothetical protein
VQAFDTGEDGPVGVAVGREVVVEGTGRVDVVVTGAVDVVVAPAVVVVVDGTGRVVAVVTVGGSLPRLRTDRAVSSGDRGHTTAAPIPRADSTTREISRRRRSVDFGGDGSNMAHTWPLGRPTPAELRKESQTPGRIGGDRLVRFRRRPDVRRTARSRDAGRLRVRHGG